MSDKVHVAVRMPLENVKQLDKLRAEKQEKHPERNISRSEIILDLVEKSAEAASAITLNTERPDSDSELTRSEKPKN